MDDPLSSAPGVCGVRIVQVCQHLCRLLVEISLVETSLQIIRHVLLSSYDSIAAQDPLQLHVSNYGYGWIDRVVMELSFHTAA